MAEEVLDLTGVPCPANAARALIAVEALDAGRCLRVLLDDGEPLQNVPASLEEQGHRVLERKRRGSGWTLLVRRGET